ncbi:GIN domain-containing protein [Massilia consociata]|uniref:GIN domain-containing protein n=1 Tax=Massilia consociata TaxID=760117 RepID=A0ABV6FK96_9BURK
MKHLSKLGVAFAALCATLFAPLFTAAGSAVAAPDTATETRPVDARVVRVRLDGVVDLKIRQGATPMLVLTGDPRLLGRTTTLQSGDTLNIGTETKGAGINLGRSMGLHAELTLPNLREVSSESLGGTAISGFSGDELELNLDGAGSMNVSCNYRLLSAKLGGVGSMKIHGINSDSVELNLSGAGHVVLSGRSRQLKAELGGLGGLDARAFAAESVILELSGLGNATVTARDAANVTLSGLGSVTVFGKPLNRKVSVDGLGKVNWK